VVENAREPVELVAASAARQVAVERGAELPGARGDVAQRRQRAPRDPPRDHAVDRGHREQAPGEPAAQAEIGDLLSLETARDAHHVPTERGLGDADPAVPAAALRVDPLPEGDGAAGSGRRYTQTFRRQVAAGGHALARRVPDLDEALALRRAVGVLAVDQ